MKYLLATVLTILVGKTIYAQEVDPHLIQIKESLDGVISGKAKATLSLDISFIKMPTKYADLEYNRGEKLQYNSENFIIIPKKGLDFSWSELFKYSFLTVDRGIEIDNNRSLKVINVIPTDDKADFAIMTLKIDTVEQRITFADITTKNQGSYQLDLDYDDAAFPTRIVVNFELEKIKIPLNFMGKDAEVDKEQLKEEGVKEGKIILDLEWIEFNHQK